MNARIANTFLPFLGLTVKSAKVNVHPDVESPGRARRPAPHDVFAVEDHLGVAESPVDLQRVPLERDHGVFAPQNGGPWNRHLQQACLVGRTND